MSEETTSMGSQQEEMPFALVQGEPLATPPEDLFIPPDALEVILEAFEGPLDLLLYLIKRQNLDILDIPVAQITAQYMSYIAMMEEMRFELAAEYLVMAAMLAEIKSRMLLPRPTSDDDEDDPRAELIRRLQEYERFKKAAEDIDELKRLHRDFQLVKVEPPVIEKKKIEPDVELKELLFAFADVLKRADMFSSHAISREPLSMRERMSKILDHLQDRDMVEFNHLFSFEEGRRGVVVTFTAILELMKAHLIDIAQAEPFAPIYIKSAAQASEA